VAQPMQCHRRERSSVLSREYRPDGRRQRQRVVSGCVQRNRAATEQEQH
jgi:hypothetical protein